MAKGDDMKRKDVVYINKEMVGSIATDNDAMLMATMLVLKGYNAEYTRDSGMVNSHNKIDIPDDVWLDCLVNVVENTI